MSNDQERVEIYIQENMDVSQRSDLVAELEHERGIIYARFEGGDGHRLTVKYECQHFSHNTLLDTINEHGFHGDIVPLGLEPRTNGFYDGPARA